MPGTLYVVATPIGNLEDITLRALRVLREADLVCAEDTRVTRKLLSHYGIHTPLVSYHEHSRAGKLQLLRGKLEAGKALALVTDAGLPGISDPGEDLVAAALSLGAEVTPIPGACAVVTGLCVSGLPAGRFAFDGFPPRQRSTRHAFFAALRDERRTIVLYEAPGRMRATLLELLEALGDRQVAVARELTKRFEEVFRGPLSAAAARFASDAPRGEFTIIVAGAESPALQNECPPSEIVSSLRIALGSGLSARDAVAQVSAQTGVPRRLVYRACVQLLSSDADSPGPSATLPAESCTSTE